MHASRMEAHGAWATQRLILMLLLGTLAVLVGRNVAFRLAATQPGGKDLIEADLRGANLEQQDLCGRRLDRAWLERASCYQTLLVGSWLPGASARHALLSGADLGSANLQGANLHGAQLIGARLVGSDLRRSLLVRADLCRARLEAADLTGARMSRASLARACFSGACLAGADLRRANLCGTDLRGADLRGADLRASFYDAETRWPTGFDPIARGARLTATGLADWES